MSSISILGDTSGSVLLQAPAVAGSPTVTLPSSTGTLAINGPAFGVYQSSAQALTTGTPAKLQFQTKEFDTDTCFNTSTYRFTPNVAGYYQLNARFRVSTSTTNVDIFIYKNGSLFKNGNAFDNNGVGAQINSLVYANGTTDYFEVYGVFNNNQNTTAGQQATWFNGFLARTA